MRALQDKIESNRSLVCKKWWKFLPTGALMFQMAEFWIEHTLIKALFQRYINLQWNTRK